MGEPADAMTDPAYREAVVDLLGTLAYGELSAFLRLAMDAELAPTLTATGALAGLAVTEFQHHEQLCERLRELGASPEEAMAPFVQSFDAFHERTAPSTWLEGLVKYVVGDGIASDFYREISAFVDSSTRELVLSALNDGDRSDFVIAEVRRAVQDDSAQASRLSLWGRRLMGEALSQGQRVVADRDSFAVIIQGAGGRPGAGLTEIVHMFGRITERHTKRMEQLGLSA